MPAPAGRPSPATARPRARSAASTGERHAARQPTGVPPRLGLLRAAAALAPATAARAALPSRCGSSPVRCPPVPGPHRTIAVGNIDVIGPVANASATNVGGAIAAMLTTALGESGQFILVERDAIAPLINEMDMAKSGVTTGSSAPRPGSMLPAQYLVVGSVTDYTATGPGSGSGGGLSFGGSTAVTLGGSKGNVGIDLRIVDTHTGEVVKSFKVHHKLTSMNLGCRAATWACRWPPTAISTHRSAPPPARR